jgi:AcrR family transcriptional regulator
MTPPVGRREANKQATRDALRRAAAGLFAAQGYEVTTVAEIARAAKVGERTFYRYFGSKDELLAERALAWIERLQAAIRSRPVAETPYQAVAAAMTAMAGELAPSGPESEGWILGPPRPLAAVREVEPRPLRRLEHAVADAILARLDASAAGSGGLADRPEMAEFEAGLLGNVAVAALRAVFVYQRRHVQSADAEIERLLGDAFGRLSALTSPVIRATDVAGECTE